MAMKIKKTVKYPDGTYVEVEGTEAEVENWEKKQEKKRQSEQSKKEKTVLYGMQFQKYVGMHNTKSIPMTGVSSS